MRKKQEKHTSKVNTQKDQIERHFQIVNLVARRIYKIYLECLDFKPEPEHFFEDFMIKNGFDADELVMFDTWRCFLTLLDRKAHE